MSYLFKETLLALEMPVASACDLSGCNIFLPYFMDRQYTICLKV